MTWFGESWGAPVNADCPRVETPVGRACIRCSAPIAVGDIGVITPYSGPPGSESTVVYHYACFMRSIFGEMPLGQLEDVKRRARIARDAAWAVADADVVHILRGGAPLCNRAGIFPSDWPAGHRWTHDHEADVATCPGCVGEHAGTIASWVFCDVCARWRPDVMTRRIVNAMEWSDGRKGRPDVRYCGDDRTCQNGAYALSFLPMEDRPS